jgi:glycogen operon protein
VGSGLTALLLNDGLPYPLGASAQPSGINFALVAPRATRVELCLFDATGQNEQQRLSLPACTDGIWHGHLTSVRPGLVYGYRVHGPWAPHDGHRFNPAKLLLDPYAREIVGRYGGEDVHAGHDAQNPSMPDKRDNAALAMKARVAPAASAVTRFPTSRSASERVMYELHVRGHTMLHPDLPADLRGTYAGLAHPAVLDHLQQLGVTTLSLMPVQHRADEQRLQAMGLSNYWGYNTIGWFAPEGRYWSQRPGTTPASEFRALSDAIHARGMELVIDVVYNHSAETDEHGPTLSMRGIDNALYYHLRPDDKALYENWTGCGNCLNFAEPHVVRLAMDSLRYWVNELGVDGFRFDLAPVLGRSAVDGTVRGGAFDAHAPLLTAIAQDPVLWRALMIAEPWDIGPDGYQLGGFPPGWLEWNDKYRDTQRGFWLHNSTGLGDFAHRFTASSGQFAHNGRAPTASVNFVTAHDGFTLRDTVSYNDRHNLANGEGNRDGHGHNLSRNFGVEGDTDDVAVLAQRARMQRVLLTTLLLSQGTPLLLAGDEIGHTQQGNNNAYCQDNETTWLDWSRGDRELSAFVARVTALRREAGVLRSVHWWAGAAARTPGLAARSGLIWSRSDGAPMTAADWDSAPQYALTILFPASPASPDRATSGTGHTGNWLVLLNAGPQPVQFTLPDGAWRLALTSEPAAMSDHASQQEYLPAAPTLPDSCIWVART